MMTGPGKGISGAVKTAVGSKSLPKAPTNLSSTLKSKTTTTTNVKKPTTTTTNKKPSTSSKPIVKTQTPTQYSVTSKKGVVSSGNSVYSSKSQIPSDSAKFMNQMKKDDPATYAKFNKYMQEQKKNNPNAQFVFSSRPVTTKTSMIKGAKVPLTGGKAMSQGYYPTIYTKTPKK